MLMAEKFLWTEDSFQTTYILDNVIQFSLISQRLLQKTQEN
jgi:hypothetical protein